MNKLSSGIKFAALITILLFCDPCLSQIPDLLIEVLLSLPLKTSCSIFWYVLVTYEKKGLSRDKYIMLKKIVKKIKGYNILKEIRQLLCIITISLCLFKERQAHIVVIKKLIGIINIMLSVILSIVK